MLQKKLNFTLFLIMASSLKSPKRILIIDDNSSYVDVACEFLKESGVEAAGAGTTAVALEEMKKSPIDLVLLDISLEGEDGLAFLPKLKALYPNVPVVMLTGHGYDNTMMRTAMASGATSYFSKENDLKDLVEMLERLV